jgi:hypothetical protein
MESNNSYYYKDESKTSNKINQSECEGTIRKDSRKDESSKNESDRHDDSKYYEYQNIWEKNNQLLNEKMNERNKQNRGKQESKFEINHDQQEINNHDYQNSQNNLSSHLLNDEDHEKSDGTSEFGMNLNTSGSKLYEYDKYQNNNQPFNSNFISRMPTELNSDLQRDLLTSKSATSFSNFAIENKNQNKLDKNKKSNTKFSKPPLNKTQSQGNASIKKQNKSISGAFQNQTTNISSNSNSNYQSTPLKNRSRSKTPVQYPPDFIPGQRLYKQFMERLPKKKEHVNKILEERRRSEMKEAKFSPSIDRKSDRMASNSADRSEGIETRLHRYGQKKREKVVKEQTRKMLENTFSYHPTVNEKSQIMATIKRRERLEDLSKDKVIKKFSATETPSKIDYSEIDDKVNSDEELYPTRNLKNSFVSSDYTFTNMNVKDQDSKAGATKNKKEIEKYKNFTNSDKDITIKTSRSRSKDKDQSAIMSEKTIKSNYSQKKVNTKDKSPARSRTPLRNRANTSNTLNMTSNQSMNKSKSPIPVKIDPEKSIHDFLYIEAKVIEQKKQEREKEHMDKKCPFKPTIPESSKKLAPRQETQDQFIKRLMNSKKEAEELIVRQKRLVDAPIDAKTGKPFFKPTVGRGPKDPKTREVTTNLDSYWDNKILQFKTKVHEEEMLNNLEKKKLFLERSMKSILKMKIEKYKEIFDLLDSDKDGYISSRNIRLSSLDSDMLFALTPLLEEIQKKSLTLSFKDFCLKADTSLSGKIFSPNANK